MENTKRDLSLDFTKPRVPRGGHPVPSLVTPVLNLSTPELHKMISEDELALLTPNGISSVIQPNILPSPLIPTTVNNSNNIINNNGNTCNGNNNNNNNHDQSNGVSSTHHNQNGDGKRTSSDHDRKPTIRLDVDLEKIEKKRERNRLAAKKCRQRKLETIDELRKDVLQWEQKYKKLEIDF